MIAQCFKKCTKTVCTKTVLAGFIFIWAVIIRLGVSTFFYLKCIKKETKIHNQFNKKFTLTGNKKHRLGLLIS